jgi:hypothetical protein
MFSCGLCAVTDSLYTLELTVSQQLLPGPKGCRLGLLQLNGLSTDWPEKNSLPILGRQDS